MSSFLRQKANTANAKKNRKMSICSQMDLETLGSRLIMPKNLPGHCQNMRAA
jgi:hypothetical protein